MKQITVIDASSDIKNKLPKEYRNMKVRFFQYSLDAFYYKSDDISILADCEYEGATIVILKSCYTKRPLKSYSTVMTGVCLLYSTNVRMIKMNNRKRELIEHLVRSVDYTKERILYWERLRTRESYDIFVRLNESDKENELVKVEYKDDIVKRIIDDYKRSFKEYDKALDELLEEK